MLFNLNNNLIGNQSETEIGNGLKVLENLRYLSLDFSYNYISNYDGILIGRGLLNLTSLGYLGLDLEDNYIDNVRFELMLENLE